MCEKPARPDRSRSWQPPACAPEQIQPEYPAAMAIPSFPLFFPAYSWLPEFLRPTTEHSGNSRGLAMLFRGSANRNRVWAGSRTVSLSLSERGGPAEIIVRAHRLHHDRSGQNEDNL